MEDLPPSAESEPTVLSRERMVLVVTAPGIEAEHILHAGRGPLLRATAFQVVDLMDPGSCEQRIAWWETLAGKGGEGMVVKPLDLIARGPRGLVQPAVNCRDSEYLRIIHGPEYLLPGNLERLRSRSLARKRSLALREFALGVESLERFARGEPLRRVHECVFGVLALESEPVDGGCNPMNQPQLVLPEGTRIVTRSEVRADTERAHRPVGSVAEIIGVPVDALHSYRVRFSDGGEASLRRKEFSLLSAYKTDEKGSAGSARRARPCGRAEAALGYA